MGKDQCQKETSLLQKKLAPDLCHANKQRSWQRKGHCQLVETRRLACIKGLALASKIAKREHKKYRN